MIAPSNRRTPPAWMRLLMLACVIIGIGAMHTLGHVSTDHATGPTAAGPAAAHGDTAPQADTSDHTDALPPLDPMSMCLAIGGSVVALLWVAAAAFRAWPAPLAPMRARARRRAPPRGRSPDPPSLSALQVLRV